MIITEFEDVVNLDIVAIDKGALHRHRNSIKSRSEAAIVQQES